MTAAPAAPTPVREIPLPALRPELELLPGSPDAQGRPTWLIHDPLLNRFVEIGLAAYECLKHWRRCRTVGELIDGVGAEGRIHTDERAVLTLIDFLYATQFTTNARAEGWKSFVKSRRARRHSLSAWLIHNYLFFRIPLVAPQRFLEATLPFARMLWSRPARIMTLLMGLLGLYLVSRQWDRFLGTLMTYLSWEGAASGLVALVFVKLAHELGHAYAAVAFGCRVHSMGIAFVVMAPMPYTDVTDAWRLTDRRKRLLIDSAGMITEAMIAAVALFAWGFTPEGPVHNATFVLSAVTVISSLAINLNPFMRFDGYYLLSETLGVANLQSRAFNLGCWRLREFLFAIGAPCPDELPPRRVAILVVYAWSVWFYRLFVFTGIALLVYHYFFKVLGLILFAVEIIFFVARPIWNELHTWWTMRSLIRASWRARLTFALAALALPLLLVPWSTTVEIPALIEAAKLQSVFPPRNAKVLAVHVHHGDVVHAGDPIATLLSTDLEDELARTRISLRIAELQHGRRLADQADRESTLVLECTIDGLRNKITGLLGERAELTLTAPFDGKIVDVNPEMHAGRWVAPRDLIAIVADGRAIIAKGYVAEADVERIARGGNARFIPEFASRDSVDLRVERIATAGATQIEIADLASTNLGRIAVTVDEKRRLIPATAQYLVTLAPRGAAPDLDLAVRGVVRAEGKPESYVSRFLRRALGVLVRESGV